MRRIFSRLNQWFDRLVNALESGLRKEAVLTRPDIYSTEYRQAVLREEPYDQIEPEARSSAEPGSAPER